MRKTVSLQSVAVRFVAASLTIMAANGVLADRQPVLRQIDVPHNYYFREMYLPQLTTGPSSLSWSPDGRSLVYSMEGSLWRQAIDSGIAEQLTAGPGYDYQPDVSPDGSRIVFVRYLKDALELYTLELASGKITGLTNEGAVNVEPRWSPDGSRIAFVSTRDTGHFHIFLGDLADGKFDASPLVEERESKISRYYYSSFDHELSPAWSPEGDALIYVSNPEVPYGSGSIWMHPLADDGVPVLVRREETTWKARPDWSPEGRRFVYASYLGRQWHQLWVTTVDGRAEPFPLTYGAYDVTAPRWSPDAKKIAYITNQPGNTEIRIQETVGGKVTVLAVDERRYAMPVAELQLAVVDTEGRPVAARVAVIGADGRSHAPTASWMHADDGFDRDHADFEAQYFHLNGAAALTLPLGAARVTVWHGPEHQIERRLINISAERENNLTVSLQSLDLPDEWTGWRSGDVHVHMNYGGTYRNTPERLVAQAEAEDLDVVFNLIVNKEQRIPDIAYFSSKPDQASNDRVLLLHSQEFHTSVWGHLGLLGLNSHLLLPGYAGYPATAAASLFPDNATVAGLARQQNAAVGYVHPFLAPPKPKRDKHLTNALPVDAALGLVDYYEVVGFADHRASAEVWYRLLNCGMRLAAAGGTDAMANYASLRGPLGVNRVYVRVAGKARNNAERRREWLSGLKSAHTMATNGPLLGLRVNGRFPGDEIALADGDRDLQYTGFLRSAVPMDHLELVHNGSVLENIELDADRKSADLRGSVRITGSGWLLLRAWNDGSHPLIFDAYPYATTSPIFISAGGERMHSKKDADYFIAWIGRIRKFARSHADYNDDAERETILSNLDRALGVYEDCR